MSPVTIFEMLEKRVSNNKPLKVGLIGAGKFGTMFLNQALQMKGLHIVYIVDKSIKNMEKSLKRIGWLKEKTETRSIVKADGNGNTFITDNTSEIFDKIKVDVIIESTGNPRAAVNHILNAIKYKTNVVNVSVEADALIGPLFTRKADENNVTYSLAYGDQPAIICELVEWAKMCGFEIVCAGKGTKYLPIFHYSTPDTVWDYYGIDRDIAKKRDLNSKIFNSFLDGTKSAIEMTTVSNSTCLMPQEKGLGFPPCGVDDLPFVCRHINKGGQLSREGTVEVVSSLERDGRNVFRDLRWGVFIVFKTSDKYVKDCFVEYGVKTDSSGYYASLYRPYHFIGLELLYSVLKVGLLNYSTGFPIKFCADVVSITKKDLKVGDVLDGEGGYTIFGKVIPAKDSLRLNALPIGLANDLKVKRTVKKEEIIRWSDVEYNIDDEILKFRHDMEKSVDYEK